MTGMSRVARAFARPVSFALVASFVATATFAGPANANHKFEHVGQSAADVAAMLPMPGMGRALVLEHDGDIRLTTGDALVNDLIYHVNVSQTFAGDGLLDATWHLAAPGLLLYVTYIQPTPRKLVVARLEFAGDKVASFDNLYSVTIPPAANQNLGGGIAMGGDGKLYVGIGDMGNPNGAQQPTTLQGKIFRLNADLPGGIPADNPVSATSPVYATGVRNPVRFATDSATGLTYFVDVGPASNDEVNIVDRLANYGWSRFSGVVMTSGFTDPIYVWATSITPTGLEVNAGSNFGPNAVGDLFVTGLNGVITRLHPNPTAPPPSTATETVLFTATAAEPKQFADLSIRGDGFAYVPQTTGMVYRLKSNAGEMGEPSDRESITPITLRKTGSSIEFAVERDAALEQFGLYTGDLAQAWSNFPAGSWYTHPTITTDLRPVDAVAGEAYSRFTVPAANFPELAYFVFSGLNGRAETGVGYSSNMTQRPGGNQTFGCPCPAAATEGPVVGQCGPDFVLTEGVEGQSAPGVWNVIGPVNFPDDYDCDVVLIDLSMEWCGPCRVMAADAEAIYQDYKDQGFMLVHVIPEDVNGNPANMAAIQRWATDFGLSFPVLKDNNYLVWGLYDTSGSIPQTILLDKEGMVVNHWVGTQSRATLSAAIERELAR